MKNFSEIHNSDVEDVDKSRVESLVTFVKKHNISSDELFTAYQLAMGIHSIDNNGALTTREEVSNLSKMMEDFMNKGLPVNRIAELVTIKKDYEEIPETYYMMVDKILKITENERKVLRSILERKRPGILTVYNPKTHQELEVVNIPSEVTGDDYPLNILGAGLVEYLIKFKDQHIEIVFEPR